jgi:hypothetical protein
MIPKPRQRTACPILPWRLRFESFARRAASLEQVVTRSPSQPTIRSVLYKNTVQRRSEKIKNRIEMRLPTSPVSGERFVYTLWGATTFPPKLVEPVLLTAAPAASLPVSATFRRFLRVQAVSPVGKETARGCKLNPGLRPNPAFPLANSPVSPVDRTRLLTAPSKPGGHVYRRSEIKPRNALSLACRLESTVGRSGRNRSQLPYAPSSRRQPPLIG